MDDSKNLARETYRQLTEQLEELRRDLPDKKIYIIDSDGTPVSSIGVRGTQTIFVETKSENGNPIYKCIHYTQFNFSIIVDD